MTTIYNKLCSLKLVLAIVFIIGGVNIFWEFSECLVFIIFVIYFQTYSPNDEILINIYSNNPHNFLKKEIELRKEKNLPPFFKLVSLIISGKNEIELQNFSIKLKNKLTKLVNTDILGPVNAPIFKIKNKYRKRILLRYPKEIYIQKNLKPILKNLKIPPKIKLEVDVDPINFH